MPPIVSVQVETLRLDQLSTGLEGRAHTVLDKAAFDILRFAEPLTAFDTGAMRSSGYVSGASGGSTFQQGAAEAGSRRPGVRILPEVMPDNAFERVIGFSVEYAYLQELRQPFLVPGTEQARPGFTGAWNELFT